MSRQCSTAWIMKAPGRALRKDTVATRLRASIAAAVVAGAALGVMPAARAATGPATHVRIGPHQAFVGLVNGSTGSPSPATINMQCFGPVTPGEMGHPVPGQTLEVAQPTATAAAFGNTGDNATQISVFFGAPPPGAATKSGAVTFIRYGVVKKIPKRLLLPCSGSGNVTFVPLPMSPPTSKSFSVPVQFAGQP
ncbi:MAG: hypothetical protein JWL83_4516 [Actinomycetia bacterium]|nr:hypothetical protein [Actinomycetes bacterium]